MAAFGSSGIWNFAVCGFSRDVPTIKAGEVRQVFRA
jgi:hypothetical protein